MIKKIASFLVIGFLVISCDNNFSPYSDFEKKYVINCILNPNDSIQTLVLMENVQPNDQNVDNINFNSMIVDDAIIRIWYNDEVIRFKQSKGANKIPEVKEGYYYVKNLPIIKGTKYQLEAVVNNIQKIKSELVVPDSLQLNLNNTSPQVPAESHQPGGSKSISIAWNYDNRYNLSTIKFYLFYKNVDTEEFGKKEIPHNLIIKDNKMVPLYEKPKRTGVINLPLTTFDKFFEEWEKEIFVSKYRLLGLGFEIIVYDQNLTEYYFSIANHKESVSVVIDDYNTSLIKGGYGLFGCFIKIEGALQITNDFKRKYGFITEIE